MIWKIKILPKHDFRLCWPMLKCVSSRFCDFYVYLGFSSRTYQEFEVTVPDSITSWVATAFVISEDLGLGLTTAPVEVVY